MTCRPADLSAATSPAEVLAPSTSYTSAGTDLSSVPVSCHCQLWPRAGFHQPPPPPGGGGAAPPDAPAEADADADAEPRPSAKDGPRPPWPGRACRRRG